MSIYFPPSLQRFEPLRMVFSTWVDHMPFGYDIVAALRPRLVVELGAYNGLSFFTFCQSMKENDIEGLCYAVDTWEGDAHTGDYDGGIVESVRAHAREHYRGSAYLLQMRFSEALPQFAAQSIDLLHIDGLHSYEAVREDFESWYPKLAPGGIVLLHDIQARLPGFGAWRFFEELRGRHECFAFRHGFGLGVLRKPGAREPGHPLLRLLFHSDAAERRALRQFYVHASAFMEARRKARRFDSLHPRAGGRGGQGKN